MGGLRPTKQYFMPSTHTFTELEFAPADGETFNLGLGLAVELLTVTAMCRGEQDLSLVDLWLLPGETEGGFTTRLLPEGRVELYDGTEMGRPRIRAAAVIDTGCVLQAQGQAFAGGTWHTLQGSALDSAYFLYPEYLDQCVGALCASSGFERPWGAARLRAARVMIAEPGRSPG